MADKRAFVKDEQRSLMLGFVIVGDTAKHAPMKFTFPPEKPDGRLFDSVMGENSADPTVLYNEGRFYPCYVISYK